MSWNEVLPRVDDLVEPTLAWGFVRPPADELGPVAKAAVGEMVVGHFDHEFGPERFPGGGTALTPSARSSWGVSREAGRLDERGEAWQQGLALFRLEGGTKPDMVQEIGIVV